MCSDGAWLNGLSKPRSASNRKAGAPCTVGWPKLKARGKAAKQASVDEVADKTIKCLKACVPAAVPGIAYLSGGQSDELATAKSEEERNRIRKEMDDEREKERVRRARTPRPVASPPAQRSSSPRQW